jgi:hypothetical protein
MVHTLMLGLLEKHAALAYSENFQKGPALFYLKVLDSYDAVSVKILYSNLNLELGKHGRGPGIRSLLSRGEIMSYDTILDK